MTGPFEPTQFSMLEMAGLSYIIPDIPGPLELLQELFWEPSFQTHLKTSGGLSSSPSFTAIIGYARDDCFMYRNLQLSVFLGIIAMSNNFQRSTGYGH